MLNPVNVEDRTSENNADSEASAGIVRVIHVIPTVYVIDVNVICVVPAYRPRFNKSKPITAVLEAGISADKHGVSHSKLVATTEIGTETFVRDSAVAPRAQP